MSTATVTEKPQYAIKEPKNLSPRIKWLRDYYFRGVERAWNNEFTAWTTGTPWDFQYEELTFYIVPETYAFLQTFRSSFKQTARKVELHPDFWQWSLPERKAWFNQEVMVRYVPQEILPGDLIAGARFNVQTIELNDLDPEVYELFVPMGEHVSSLFTNHDLEIAAGKMPNNSAAMLLLWENLWVANLYQAMEDADGHLVERTHIAPEIVEEFLQDLAAEEGE